MSKRITHAVGGGRTSEIILTQHSALGDLRRFGYLVPPMGNQRCNRGTVYGFGAKTLQALVDAGFAEWYIRPLLPRRIVEKGRGERIDAERARRAKIAQAEAYVQTRFFPPLPAEYGKLAVEALETYEAFEDPDAVVEIPSGLQPKPRNATPNGDHWLISCGDLIEALRIGHMIDEFE